MLRTENIAKLMPTVLLIDAGSFFIRRIFNAVSSSGDGFTDEEAVETVVQSVIRLLLREDSAYALCAFDSLSASTWHQTLAPAYIPKSVSLPERYRAVLPLAMEALADAGIRAISVPGLESDDILASVCYRLRREAVPVRLVSNDVGLVQLLDPGVTIAEPFSDVLRDTNWLERRLGIEPTQIPAYFALAGARSGLGGVPGIGPRRASELLRDYKTLPRILTAAQKGTLSRALCDNLLLFAPTVRILEQMYTARTDILFGLNVKDLHLERNLHGADPAQGREASALVLPGTAFHNGSVSRNRSHRLDTKGFLKCQHKSCPTQPG